MRSPMKTRPAELAQPGRPSVCPRPESDALKSAVPVQLKLTGRQDEGAGAKRLDVGATALPMHKQIAMSGSSTADTRRAARYELRL